MAELDYAFIADFAKVEPNGTLTVNSASWTSLRTPVLPVARRLAIAGRIRAHVDESPVALQIVFSAPDQAFNIGTEALLSPGPDARPYGDGKIGHLFALDWQVLLPSVGLYTINITINGEHARRLAFDVESA